MEMVLEGWQIGRYRILQLIGSGAMGDVYLAEDSRIGQQVAIKVIRGESDLYPDRFNAKEAAHLFQREAQAIVRLDSPRILPLFDYGEELVGEMNIIYLVMPYRKDGSLAKWLSQRTTSEPLSPQDVAYLIAQVAEALQHAHNHQIIHRDVKPSNLLLRLHEETPTRPDILLADFGIAQLMTTTSHMSQSVRGTPTYMAPEQWAGGAVPASDQYALAIMAYELLTGHPPFRGGALQVMYQHMHNQPEAPGTQNPRLSKEIDEVLLRALAKKADERFASVSAFAHAFQEAVDVFVFSEEEQDLPTVLRSTPSLEEEQDLPTVLRSTTTEELRVVLAISETEAQTGTVRTITLPGGREVMVKVPAGIQNGSVIHLGEHNTDARDITGTVILSIMIKQETEALPFSNTSTTASLSDKEASTASTVIVQDQVPISVIQPAVMLPAEPDTDKPLLLSSVTEHANLAHQTLPKSFPVPSGKDESRTRLVIGSRQRRLFAIGLLILILLLIGGSIFVAPGFLSSSVHKSVVTMTPTKHVSGAMAVVTMTPMKKELQHTYTILAVTGPPDSAKQQVTARQLTTVTAPQSQTAQATGTATTLATYAGGTLTLYNYNTSSSLTLSAGMKIPNMQSTPVDMILDTAVTAPPGQDASNPGTAYVQAHVAQAGTIGNLPTVTNGDAGFYYCTNCPNGNVQGYEIENDMAFSGGRGSQTVTTVQQSDIDNVANTLEAAHAPNPQQIFQEQLHANEQLINAAQCAPSVSSDHAAGEQATSVTVTVTFTCTGEVYDQSGALALAQKLLTNQAIGDLGPHSTHQGSIAATMIHAVLTDTRQGTITLTIATSGIWIAQFDGTSLQALAVSIAGKTRQEAQAILAANKDIARANIQISGGNGDVLPTDVHYIRMVTNL
jgi:serine/threonine protein kinase